VKESILEFPNRSTIAEEAGAWLVRLDGDQPLSAEEQFALREWLQRSALHREELNELAVLWGKVNCLTELAVPLEKSSSTPSNDTEERRRPGYFGGLVPLGATATIVVIGFALLLTLWMRSDPWEAKDGMYATAVGQQKRMILADGSVALLNTNSQIEVEYGENFRDIHLLQGEAYFEVAKNLNQPFRVYAGNGRIQAVGTAFSVLLKVNAVDVTVTEGKVALASLVNTKVTLPEPSGTPPGQTRPDTNNRLIATELGLLSAGQSITIREAAGAEASKASIVDEIEIVDQQEMSKRQSWQRGIITFAGDPLEKVVEEISRYTTVRIEITDPAVRAIKIGGQFPVGETDAMLNALEANFGLRVTRVAEDHVLLASSQDS